MRSGSTKPGRLSGWVIRIGFLVLLVLLWHLATARWGVSRILLPAPGAVFAQLVEVMRTGDYVEDLKVTLGEVLVAFTTAAACGLVLGYLVSRSAYLVRVFEPLFSGIYAIPAILFFPLFVLIFGLGPASKIAIGITISFFPVVLSTISGFGTVDKALIIAARSMGASGYRLFRWVLLPAAFPVVLTGLRMGFILALLAILGGEIIASLSGLGHRIVTYSETMETAHMFAYIAFVVAIAVALNALVGSLAARARRGEP
jgi:ABC-type nitrate/sulfonate/bicarbonate transport system permease component